MNKGVAVALAKAVQSVDRSTGLSHSFRVKMHNADGTEVMEQSIAVIALNWADAWELIGVSVQRFMNGPHSRMVYAVQAEGPAVKVRT